MCIQTIYLRKLQLEVPCGKCYECVKRRRNDWYIRCLIESRTRAHTYFGLLTYAKVGQRLQKRDVQLFLKRLRAYGYKFSYLIAGEHGPRTERPHWHCLFFTNTPIHFAAIAKSWRGGYKRDPNCNKAGWVRFEPIRSPRSIRYTVKYLYKYDGKDSRFTLLISKNPAIGKSFLRYQHHCLESKSSDFTIDGKRFAMPRYYKRKIFDDYPDIKEEVNSKLAAKVAELNDRELMTVHSLRPDLNYHELVNFIKQQKVIKNEQIRNAERSSRQFRKNVFRT